MTGYDDKTFLAWESTFVKIWGTLFLGVPGSVIRTSSSERSKLTELRSKSSVCCFVTNVFKPDLK